MALKGKESIKTKIVLNNLTLEQVSDFRYLGCDISFFKIKDLGKTTAQISKYLWIFKQNPKKQSPKRNQT